MQRNFLVTSKLKNALLFFIAVWWFSPLVVSAATLKFNTGQNYAIGASFSVQVVVSTDAPSPLNAVSAAVAFPQDKLQLQSISKVGSIISYWAEEPSFSNALGTANIEGVVLNPGWSGNSGQVVTLNFKVKAVGNATISFSQAAVLANDGLGTNILNSAIPATITLGAGEPAPQPQIVTESSSFAIKSSTHPNQNAWYKNNSPKFSWSLPQGTTAVRLLYDKNSNSTPSIEYTPAISEKILEDVEDGSYYMHVQFRVDGVWGNVSHYKFNIDTEAPESFKITLAHDDTTDDPRPILYFNTSDVVSGIQKYFVEIGTDKGVILAADEKDSNPYTPPNLKPGENKIVVTAYDNAGNTTVEETVINIEVIDAPIITDYENSLLEGDLLRIRGETYPNSTLFFSLKDKDGVVTLDTARSNSLGNFSLVWTKHLNKGLYTFTAYVVDDKGARSYDTESYSIKVTDSNGAWYQNFAKGYLALGILVIFITSLLVALAIYFFHHLKYFNNHVQNKLQVKFHKLEHGIHHDFESLREELETYITKLRKAEKKRTLTKEEKIFMQDFGKYIGMVEKDVIDKLDSLQEDIK